MLFTTSTITNNEINEVNNFFSQFDNEFEAVKTVEADEIIETSVSKYITSLVSSQYQKSVEDIENTKEMTKDPDLGEMAKEELKALEEEKAQLDGELEILLIPKDPNDDNSFEYSLVFFTSLNTSVFVSSCSI